MLERTTRAASADADLDLPLEHAASALARNAAHHLVRPRVRRAMQDARGEVRMRAVAHEIDAAEIGAGADAIEFNFRFQPREARAFGQHKLAERRVLAKPHPRQRHGNAGAGLQDEACQRRIGADVDIEGFGGKACGFNVREQRL